MKGAAPAAFAALLLCLTGACRQGPSAADLASAERAIRETEVEWSKVAGAKDVEKFISFYASDAAVLAPGAPTAVGTEAIRKGINQLFSAPGLSLSFQTSNVGVASGGDIAYTYGTYTMAMNDPSGKPMTDRGKYVTVYKKQADGTWKAVVDTFNSDLSPQAENK